jgi:hypothetical protein
MVTEVCPDSAATALILNVKRLPVLPAVTNVGVKDTLAGAAAAGCRPGGPPVAAADLWAATAAPDQLAPAAAVTAMTASTRPSRVSQWNMGMPPMQQQSALRPRERNRLHHPPSRLNIGTSP